MAHLTEYEVLTALAEDMKQVNAELQADQPTKFNSALLEIIQKEIGIGKSAALAHRRLNPDAKMYVYYTHFPLCVFENLSKEFLQKLDEELEIELYHKEGFDHAMIKIVYRF